MRLGMMLTIMQIEEKAIHQGRRLRRTTSSEISIIHSKYFCVLFLLFQIPLKNLMTSTDLYDLRIRALLSFSFSQKISYFILG